MRVLIIEDNPVFTKMVAEMLAQDAAFEVECASTLSSGLHKLEKQPVDSVLLDLNLPDSFDLKTFEKIRSHSPDVSTVVLTSVDDEKKALQAVCNGAQDYLLKGELNQKTLSRSLKYAVERKKTEHALKEKNQELKDANKKLEEIVETSNRMALSAEIASVEMNQIFNTAGDAMWVLDKNFNILRINDTFLHFLNNTRDEIIGKKCKDVFPSSLCDSPNCPMGVVKSGENRFERDMEVFNRDGTRIPFIITSAPFRVLDGEIVGIISNFKDIKDRKQAEENLREANKELELQSKLDGLTKIANRRRFDECLKNEWARMRREKKPLSIIICDIDFFKLYNDTYGHQSGDNCLIDVAGTIDANVKRAADLAARYGGEEFGVILPDTPAEGALFLGDTIRKKVRDLKIAHAASKADQYVTLSLGVSSTAPDLENSPEALLRVADQALYEAKKMGRNRLQFKPFRP